MKKSGFKSAGVALMALAALVAIAPAAEAQTGLQYYAVTPCRAYDSRQGTPNPLPAATQRDVTIKGVCGVPSTAKAVSLNATIVAPTVDGFFSMWPTGGTFPLVSTLNFLANEPALANGAIVPVKNPGTPDLAIAYGTTGGGQTHVVLDVTGYFQ